MGHVDQRHRTLRTPRTRSLGFLLCVLCVMCVDSAKTPAQGPKRMSLIDLNNLQRIAVGPQLSPDGRTLVYGLSFTDWKLGRLVYHLWRQDVGGGTPVQLTFTEGGDTPILQFSPDGKTVFFMRDGQLWLICIDAAEPRPLTKHVTRPAAPLWAPDGKSVYFIATDPR